MHKYIPIHVTEITSLNTGHVFCFDIDNENIYHNLYVMKSEKVDKMKVIKSCFK